MLYERNLNDEIGMLKTLRAGGAGRCDDCGTFAEVRAQWNNCGELECLCLGCTELTRQQILENYEELLKEPCMIDYTEDEEQRLFEERMETRPVIKSSRRRCYAH